MKRPSTLILIAASGLLTLASTLPLSAQAVSFRRGDSTADGVVNLSDVIHIANYLFLDGEEPTCQDASDFNDDGEIDLADAAYGLRALFPVGESPLPVDLECGVDLTPDMLTCETYDACPAPARQRKEKATPKLLPDDAGAFEVILSTGSLEELPAVMVEIVGVSVQSVKGDWYSFSECTGLVVFGDGRNGARLPVGPRNVGAYRAVRLEIADSAFFLQGDRLVECKVVAPVLAEQAFVLIPGKTMQLELALDFDISIEFDPDLRGYTLFPRVGARGAVFEPNGVQANIDEETLMAPLKELLGQSGIVETAPLCDESWFIDCSAQCLIRMTQCLMEFPIQDNCYFVRDDGTVETNCCVAEYLRCMGSCGAKCPEPGAEPLQDWGNLDIPDVSR